MPQTLPTQTLSSQGLASLAVLTFPVRKLWRRWRKPGTVTFVKPPLAGLTLDLTHPFVPTNVKRAIWREKYEADEAQLAARHLEKTDIVLEIGAGIGLMSILCAKLVGDACVHTFEANPALEELIHGQYRLNGVAPTLTIGFVGMSDTPREFYADTNFIASSAYVHQSTATAITVPQHPLSGLLATLRPTFLIIDCEGGEAELLIDTPLPGVKKICLEVHPDVIGQQNVDAILTSLKAQGFRLHEAETSGRTVFFSRTL